MRGNHRVWVYTSEQFVMDCHEDDLSDAAYRMHHEAITWCVLNGYESGELGERQLRMTTWVEDYDATADELVRLGYWRRDGSYFTIVKHLDQQTHRATVAKRREKHARRVKASRHPDFLRLTQDIKAGKHACARCELTDELTVDHRDPLSNDGAWDEANLQVLCRRCNSLKNDKVG